MKRKNDDPDDEWYLTAAECAERIHCHETDWWGIAERSRILRAGKVNRGRHTFWLRTFVVRYMRSDEASQTEPVSS